MQFATIDLEMFRTVFKYCLLVYLVVTFCRIGSIYFSFIKDESQSV